jgi:hypothetical protein
LYKIIAAAVVCADISVLQTDIGIQIVTATDLRYRTAGICTISGGEENKIAYLQKYL